MSRGKMITGMSVIGTLIVALMIGSSWFAEAASPQPLQGHDHLIKGPLLPNMNKSLPLHLPINPPKLISAAKTTLTSSATQAMAGPQTRSASTNLALSCPKPTIDLKLLLIAADGNETDLPAIQQSLDYLGTPYTLYTAAKTPGALIPSMLSTGCHGYYQGVILTDGSLVYNNGKAWTSALTQQEWTNLWNYESLLNIRQLSWYTYPTPDFGYQNPVQALDTSKTSLLTKLSTQGQTTFSYLNKSATIPIQNAYTYLAKPLADGTTIPLLSDATGNALAAIRNYKDGRQGLSLTFDSNPNLTHSILLSYGLINWLTKGLFLGERHIYVSPQVDDLFIDDSDWKNTTPCGTPVDNTGNTYRITNNDLQAIITWQKNKRATPTGTNLTLTMAYNGYGTTPGAYAPDTLTSTAKNNQGQFNWVSHTYDHTNLDTISYAAALTEIKQNNQVASSMNFGHFSTSSMVTPDVSGLTNASFLKAAFDSGIRYLVTDTSKPGYANPSPNAGLYNTYQPQLLMLPRRPNNLFYNVSTPAGWVAEYNCIYQSYWGKSLSYNEILEIESQNLLGYMLKGDIDPWMFHQPNLRAYDGVHTLLSDLLDLTMQKYNQYYTLPILSPTMDTLGQKVAQRMQYNSAGVSASIIPGISITLTALKAARVPVTGLLTNNAETYGGQHISYINLVAGQSVTIPL